ncbi:DUF1289 domain-containing protein [Dyella sp. KRB-257]|uniref:DUF1289 domain-containing protein n=1 Tax=Dyella sp. KRB-257 TaxID=3400915 RepID=UPI003BFC54A5
MSTDPRASFPQAPLTPCIGLCRLDGRGYCLGCQRSMGEIARWGSMPDTERLYLMRVVLPTRKAS